MNIWDFGSSKVEVEKLSDLEKILL